ncbi:MAG: PH domain-containing protein [Patescibacteria group bacterium]
MHIESLLHPREEVLILLRRDSWVLIRMVFFYGTLLLAPILLFVILQLYATAWLSEQWSDQVFQIILVLSVSLYYMFVWVFFFRSWLDYYLDVWFVTNERVVSIEQQGLFSRSIAEQKLYRIQDVYAEVRGVVATFFDFGNVTIQTAGASEFFIFKEIPRPHQVARNIAKLAEWDKKSKRAE